MTASSGFNSPFRSFLTLIFALQLLGIARSGDDFADVNSILKGVTIKLPNVPTMSSGGYSIDLTEIVCRDISIQDASLTSRNIGLGTATAVSSGVQLQWTIEGLTFNCEANYRYEGLLGMVNEGDVYLYSRDNRAVTTATVSAPLSGAPQPPTNIIMNSCTPEVQIVDVDFDNGGIFGWVLDTIEGMLRTAMENIAEDKICEELQVFLENNTKDLLEYIAGEDGLRPYLPVPSSSVPDSSSPNIIKLEKEFIDNLVLSKLQGSAMISTSKESEYTAETELLTFQQQESTMGRWMNDLIQRGVLASNKLVSAEDDLAFLEELQINQWLREFMLDDDGALVLSASSVGPQGFPMGGVLYDNEDLVTHTTIILERVKLLGLDSLTEFSPFKVVGNYTLETSLTWKYLALEADVMVTVRPSTRPDSVIETTKSSGTIRENVKVMLGVDGLNAGASLMTALNQTAIENSIHLGSLLKSNMAAVDCLLSTIVDLEFSSLLVEVTNDILTPSIEGFVSPGLDRLFSQAMDASFLMYEKVLLAAAPSYFQNELRPMLTQKILQEYLLTRKSTNQNGSLIAPSCVPWDSSAVDFNLGQSEMIDFRDLFLPSDQSRALGGSGSEIYGDVFSGMIMPYFYEELSDPATLNSQWMSKVTKEQSGKEGLLEFHDVFLYEDTLSASPLYDRLEVRISKISIDNIDTVSMPLELLQPTEEGNILNNQFSMSGRVDGDGKYRYLNATFRVFVGIDGDNSPLQMSNEVDFSISIPATSISFAILADIKERAIMEFPVKDIANPYCWLAIFADDGNGNEKKLDISTLSFSLLAFYMDSQCLSSSSPGCHFISEVIDQIEDAGFANLFKNEIINLFENVISSTWDALEVEKLIEESSKYCPHSNSFDSSITVPQLKVPRFTELSRSSAETILALTTVGIQIATIVWVKNHSILLERRPNGELDSPSSTEQFLPAGDGIIDWTNLSDIGSWVQIAFDEFREYIATQDLGLQEEGVSLRRASSAIHPRANDVLREFVLDEDGVLSFGTDDPVVPIMGISLSKVNLRGLDTITEIEPFVVLDKHRLNSKVHLHNLSLGLEFEFASSTDATDNTIELVYAAKDITLDVDTMIALNTTKMSMLQLGSMFDTSYLSSCAMSGVQAAQISRLDVNFGEISSPELVGLLSTQLGSALIAVFDSLRDSYQDEILGALPSLAGSTIREVINVLIPKILESMVGSCPSAPEYSSDGLIDFRALLLSSEESKKAGGSESEPYGNVFQIIYSFLDQEFMSTGASSRPVLNDWLKTLTSKQSGKAGTFNVTGTALNTTSLLQIAGLEAELGVEISDVLVENLDSIGDPLYLFLPVNGEPHVLDNKLSFGVDSKPMRFQAVLSLSLNDGAKMKIKNDVQLSFLVEDVTIQASVLMKILENSISSFPIGDLTNINCWAATILPTLDERSIFEGIQLFDQSYSTGQFEMNISCKSCTSPDFDKLLLSLYEPQDVAAAIREQTNSLMESGFVQKFLNDFVSDSKKRCPHRIEFDPSYAFMEQEIFSVTETTNALVRSERTKNPKYFSIANSVIACSLIIAGLFGKAFLSHRNRKWVKSLSNEGQFFLECQRKKQLTMDDWLNENTESLFRTSSIPKTIRYGVPVLIFLNAGLYLVGHLGLLSVVNLDVTVAGQSFTIDNFLEFRFLDSTWNSYQNGGAEMVVLLWIFTGIWPYIKLLLSLAVWILPPKHLSVKHRGTVLLWIDALVRLSVIDIFTLIIGVAILLIFIGGRDTPVNGDGIYYALKAIIVPKAGCYCIIIAQRISRVSSQFLLEYHEKLVQEATKDWKRTEGDFSISQVVANNQIEANSSFEIESPSIQIQESRSTDESHMDLSQIPTNLSIFSQSSWKVYRWGHFGAMLGGVTILIVFIIGCAFAPAIAFDISTVGGIALDSDYTYDEAVSEYGVFIVISGILLKARFILKTKADYIGLGLLLLGAGIAISSTFIIKSFHFIRRRIRKRRGVESKPSYGHEGCGLPSYFRLYKWKCMEIFFISVCIGVWQLGSIVSYSIHLYCSILTVVFDMLTSIGVVEPTQAQCNQTQALLPGNLIITLGSFFILLASFYLQARAQYKRNLDRASEYIDDNDIPTLSLAFSRDKSKNTRYSHLTESLSRSFFDSDTMSSGTCRTSIGNSQQSTISQRSASFRESLRRNLSRTASMGSVRNHRQSRIQEVTDEDEISIPVASPIFESSSTTIVADCELTHALSQNQHRSHGLQSSTRYSRG